MGGKLPKMRSQWVKQWSAQTANLIIYLMIPKSARDFFAVAFISNIIAHLLCRHTYLRGCRNLKPGGKRRMKRSWQTNLCECKFDLAQIT